MPDILPLLLCLQPVLSKTQARQLAHIVGAMLAMTGRITQLGISRWTDQGGSYRTIQRFFHTDMDWLLVQWAFFVRFAYDPTGVYVLAGDETVISKSGKHTFGVDRFFSSLAARAIPSIACFSIALLHVGKRQAYSLCNEQVVRTDAEKEQARQRKQQQKQRKQKKEPNKPRGRPVGSKNNNRAQGTLSPELRRTQAQTRNVLARIGKKLSLSYLVLDGHFGHQGATLMARQLDLHLISKLRSDSALYQEPTALQKPLRPRLKYGDRLDFANLPKAWRRSEETKDGYLTQVYQVRCLHKHFDRLLNVVILTRTHLASGRVGHVILFSSDLFLTAETVISYYTLRFQIEFTFRDAKQHFGLEDFMGVTKTSVANGIGLPLFMGNLSAHLLEPLRLHSVEAGIVDLKSGYRGRFYASLVLKMLPQRPEPILCERLIEQIGRLGCIHASSQSASDLKMAA